MSDLSLTILTEKPEDAGPIERLHERTFGPGRYARTAYRIREKVAHRLDLSFTARVGTLLVGSVRLTPVRIGETPALLLGPLTIEPPFRDRGIAKALMERAIAEAKAEGPQAGRAGRRRALLQARRLQARAEGQVKLDGPVDPGAHAVCRAGRRRIQGRRAAWCGRMGCLWGNRMNGAESLVRTLVNGGVNVCFSNPGTSEMHFVAALDRVDGMRCVLALFEGVATGAADGYARMAEKPAATLLHLGPGLANGLANLHNASKASTPVVNIVGDHATYHRQYDAPLTSDIETAAAPFSGWVRTSPMPSTSRRTARLRSPPR